MHERFTKLFALLTVAAFFLLREDAFARKANYPQTAVIRVTGTVTDANREALPGVSVSEKGTTNGTVTDGNGRFSLTVTSGSSILVFRYVGFLTKEAAAGDGVLQVQLEQDVHQLSSVVVTALGIRREEKALGYSIATLSGDQVSTVKEVNIANALSGKVAGVNVRSASADPGATPLVVIRGQGSFQGYNQPLYVVDGIPLASAIRMPEQPVGESAVDYGSTVADINPDDIAGITVLKGASASALYGSRAINGVILITTKTGMGGKKGLGVTVNSSVMFDQPWLFPQFQNEFGAGDRPGTEETVSEASWGPRINPGAKHIQWNSPVDASGDRIPTEWIAYPRRHKDFFNTGHTLTNNVAVAGGNSDGSFRLSYTNLSNSGIVPNTGLDRNTLNLAAAYKLHPKIKVSTNIGYTKNTSANRPTYNRGSAGNIVYTTTPNVNIKLLRDYWMPGREGLEQFSHVPGSMDNPYFVAYEFINSYDRNRLTGNVELNVQLTKNLSLMGRTAMDLFNETRESKRPFGSIRNPVGAYALETEYFREQNTDFLLTYKKTLSPDISFSVSAGGNRMDQQGRSTVQSTESLVSPGIYNISNARAGTVYNNTYRFRKRINSLYGMTQLAFRNYAFLDLTARNDWSSTLPAAHNAYFYPSVSGSLILSDMLHLQSDVLSFAKLRAGWAQVGGDTGPYELYNTYTFGQDWGDVKRAYLDDVLKNSQLKPLIATSYELGTDIRFFKGRLGLDFTYYNTVNRNQILNVPTTMASGYGHKLVNAGSIRNRGVELSVNAVPLANAFRWELQANFTRNRNKVLRLTEGLGSFLLGGAEGVRFEVREGTEMGDFYALGWATVPDGPHKGEPLLNQDGSYRQVNGYVKIGNYNPDFMLGFSNTFTFKKFTLNLLLDYRQGGEFYSYVAKNLLSDGRTINTLPGRDAATGGLPWTDASGNQRTDGMVLYGYIEETPGNYVLNDRITDPENYYGEYYWSFNGRSTFSATYVKLREASLTYDFSSKTLGRFIRKLSVSFIARNLFTWTAADKGYDPETAMTIANGSISPGVASWSLPYTRSFGARISVNF